jgi:flagellar assembly protein FliH
MSSSNAAKDKQYTGKVLMGVESPGPSQMSLQEMEGKKRLAWDEAAGEELMRRVRAKAQAMAKDLLVQAQAEAEQIKADAHDQGYQEGLQQAQAELDQAVSGVSEQVAGVLQSLQSQGRQLYAEQRQDIVGLLRMAVEKVINASMADQRLEITANLLDEALERIDSRRELTVRCSPDDHDLLEELLRQAQDRHPDLQAWKLRADPGIAQGGVVLDSGVGLVNNSLDARMESVSFVFDQLLAAAGGQEQDEEHADQAFAPDSPEDDHA